ncbi:sulfatase family protein [Fodinibius sediminis]|uniref:Arylsulfatase A n=1 Tax=Fodinibius sediminis TaxID=1214077 RepID=A0A521DP13_9BACT|nr:sulfatase [Fodinibius sediminis]SMO73464.1 Arylsulfatase A [Fodinibius sediminis]
MNKISKIPYLLALILFLLPTVYGQAQDQPTNVIFILSDDHRYDYMGFHPESPDFLKTPGMDRMAREGAHLANAFVTTSLCSPSRASILTGQYAFRHGAVDNANPMIEGTQFFPEQLQNQGYQTGYFGKWHIGNAHDDPKPGFDRWVSFRGQGVYNNPTLNIDGERRKVEGYTTDLLTDFTLDWIENRDQDKPFFAYLSHKAVHAEFYPAERHNEKYADAEIPKPQSMKNIESNYAGKPDWVREQRYSWHGVDHMYHGRADHPQNLDEIITEYSETLMGVDESISRVLDYLEKEGLAENTLVIYMGDNGFMLGEHGLIDKRQAYEESMRVPMLAWAPGYIEAGSTIDQNVLNIDIAPTFLDLASGSMPEGHTVDGRSFLPLLGGEDIDDWRSSFVYQYFWEHAFPHTPTTYAIREDRYKYIYYHGVWDKNELYDLQNDPKEMHNLIDVPAQQQRVKRMREELFDILETNQATDVKFRRPSDYQADEKLIE